MQRFDYNLQPLTSFAKWLPVAIAVAYFTRAVIPWWIWLVVLLWNAVCDAIPVARVTVTDSLVTVKYLLPFRKTRVMGLDDLRGIEPVKMKVRGKHVPFVVHLHPKAGTRIMICSWGTQQLEALITRLEEQLPHVGKHV